MILDTNFLIDLMNNDHKAVSKLNELSKKGVPQIVTTPSLFELWSGVVQSSKPDNEKKKIREVLINQTLISLDKKSSEEAGQIDGILIKKGVRIEVVDSMIAGIAKIHNKKVLTRNIKHFERTGVEIESY